MTQPAPRGLAFTADIAPLSVNRAYAPARWGKRHGFRKTDEAHAYARRIQLACAFENEGQPRSGPVRVRLAFYWPTEAGDVDGPIKLTLDALQGFAYENDRQVKELHVLRLTDKVRPRVTVEVEPLAEVQERHESAGGAGAARNGRSAIAAQEPADFRKVLGPKALEKLNRRRLQPAVRRP